MEGRVGVNRQSVAREWRTESNPREATPRTRVLSVEGTLPHRPSFSLLLLIYSRVTTKPSRLVVSGTP